MEEREKVNTSVLMLEEELDSWKNQGEQWKTELETTTQQLHNTREELVSGSMLPLFQKQLSDESIVSWEYSV